MRSQIFAGLALGVVTMVAGAPLESRASSEQITIDAGGLAREDTNGNDNWDTITGADFNLITSSGTVHCEAKTFPDPSIPSNVYTCDDSAYSFQISSRPGYGIYNLTISHIVSEKYATLLLS